VILWLDSDWWVMLWNEFARALDIVHRVLGSAADALSAITSDPHGADGADPSILGSAVIEAAGSTIGRNTRRLRVLSFVRGSISSAVSSGFRFRVKEQPGLNG
jgi:hypothetical protein